MRQSKSRSILAGLLLGASLTPISLLAQEPLPVVVIEKPGGNTEMPQETIEAHRAPSKLTWGSAYKAVGAVVPLTFDCCDPPPQFTLTPARPFFDRAGHGGALHMGTGSTAFMSSWSSNEQKVGYSQPMITLDRDAYVAVELIDLKPGYMYLLDFRIDPPNRPFLVEGSQIDSTNGHVLAIVTTNSSGDAWIYLSNFERDPKRWSLYDVVVTELQPAR